jgi:DNA-binding MarR family transcriptional regulator
MWLVWEAFQHTRRAIDEVVRAQGVSAAQLGVLNRLSDGTGLSGAEVARRMLTTPQAAHLSLTTLERKHLIERSFNTPPGRIVHWVLTPEGHRVVEACRVQMRTVDHRLRALLTAEERQILAALLLRYVGRSPATG